jgi:hypothetical protein
MPASVFDRSAPNLGPFAVQNPARAPSTPNVLYLSDGRHDGISRGYAANTWTESSLLYIAINLRLALLRPL